MSVTTPYQFQNVFYKEEPALNIWLDYVGKSTPTTELILPKEKRVFHYRGSLLIIVYYKSIRKGFFKKEHTGWYIHSVETYQVITP